MMKAILIDDEYSNRMLLASMLKKHCPDVMIIGDADSVDTGFEMINRLQPDLVFLDVKMPEKSGFDLLRMFKEINFSVIFVTGFDEYAIKAFEFNALDYILKPIDYSKLVKAVKKAEAKIISGTNSIIHFVHSLEEKTNYIKKITVHDKDKVHVIDLNDIIYIAANKNYSKIFDNKQRLYVSPKPLLHYEELLYPFRNFMRVNKSYIINSGFLISYSKGSDCSITLAGCDIEIEISRRKKTEIIQLLKDNNKL